MVKMKIGHYTTISSSTKLSYFFFQCDFVTQAEIRTFFGPTRPFSARQPRATTGVKTSFHEIIPQTFIGSPVQVRRS